jgi:predicted aspartyl protease
VSARRRGNRVPGYRAYGGILIVPSLLNQKRRAYMMVDSGAAYCCITPEIARLLGYDLHRPLARRSIASASRLRIYGVLGVNFLEQFRSTFDFDTATLILRVRSV